MSLGAAFVAGAAFAPSTADAVTVTINNVVVTSTQGGDVQTWCISGCADPDGGPIWASAANTALSSPQSAGTKNLILTQNSPTAFNFDTSEHSNAGSVVICAAATPCTMALTVTVNGVPINIPLSANNELNNFNADAGGTAHQEARNFNTVLAGSAGGITVAIGYADTAHSDACGDTAGNNGANVVPGQINGNCIPDPFSNAPGTTLFVGQPVNNDPGCARTDNPVSCFDAGAILIRVNDAPVTTPEPASMFLLGAGLVGFAAWNRKRRKE